MHAKVVLMDPNDLAAGASDLGFAVLPQLKLLQ